jgi:Na+/H+ antiporter NhaA
MTDSSGTSPSVGQTEWASRQVAAPLRSFLRTEAASAGVLVTAILAALVWSNVSIDSYESVWRTSFSIRLGSHGITRDLHTWVNSGLMTFFFLVIGLEARRELDLGELRDRKRFILPLVGGLLGMLVPVAIYLVVNRGTAGADGWGTAMSTDTALALGFLALLGPGVSDRVRVFLLTMFVVDDLVALVVIATAYSGPISWGPVALAVVVFVILVAALRLGVDRPMVYLLMGVIIWAALLDSGIDPVVAGLAIGLTGSAYSPSRSTLEQATGLFRSFREQPTAELAQSASVGLRATLSPNARLQHVYHPWSSFVIVPLFALANAGFAISSGFISDAVTSPVTLGIVAGYVVGKPVAIFGTSWLITRISGGRIRPPIGWLAVAGSGTIAGTGFTVSLLIAALAFNGPELAEAKFGVMVAVLLSVGLTAIIFRSTSMLSPERRARALLGRTEELVDLALAVDLDRDHVRGADAARVTLLEYGDFECPYCGIAESAARAELASDKDLTFVWRHLPLTDVHPQAQLAAEASEAAGAQGAFWPMHDLLLTRQERLSVKDLLGYADELGLDRDRFHQDLSTHAHAARVACDVESADLSGVSGTPTFFINGRRHYGAYDVVSLTAAIKTARDRGLAEQRASR